MKKIFSALIIAGLFVSGCAHKGVVKETEQPQQQKSTLPQSRNRPTINWRTKKYRRKLYHQKIPTTQLRTPCVLLKELQAKIRDIHFDFDKYIIKN